MFFLIFFNMLYPCILIIGLLNADSFFLNNFFILIWNCFAILSIYIESRKTKPILIEIEQFIQKSIMEQPTNSYGYFIYRLLTLGPNVNNKKVNPKSYIAPLLLWISVFLFIVSCFLTFMLDESRISIQIFSLNVPFLSGLFSTLTFGIDGLNYPLILLTTFLTPLCLIFSWISIRNYFHLYLFLFLLIEVMTLFVFSTLDLIIFVIFFEAVLVPMFLIILFWGSRSRKVRASFMFFMYTAAGSIPMFLALVLLYLSFSNEFTNYNILLDKGTFLPWTIKKTIWFCFLISFAIKMPIAPFHVWLPEAHVEAPTSASVFLAGVLLKLGTYGFLRYCVEIFPDVTMHFLPFVFALGCMSLIYTSLTAIRQTDIKRIIAYSSVAHMSTVLMGLCCLKTPFGITGATFQMFSHGLVASGLFFCIGVLYDRSHTRNINYYGGLVKRMPWFSFIFALLLLANAGLPLTCNFIGEFLLCLAITLESVFAGFITLFSVIFSVIYSLWLLNRIVFMNRKVTFFSGEIFLDLTKIEFFVLAPIALNVVFFGLFPFYTFALRTPMEISSFISFISNI